MQTLIAAQNSYAETEASNAAAMQLTSATSPATPTSPTNIALIMGGTGNPTPNSAYLTAVEQAYLAQNYPGYTLVSLQTLEQLWPISSAIPVRKLQILCYTFPQLFAQAVVAGACRWVPTLVTGAVAVG